MAEEIVQRTLAEPWSQVAPYLEQLFQSAQGAFNATPRAPYGGNFFAPVSPYSHMGFSGMGKSARGMLGQGRSTINLGQSLASGAGLQKALTGNQAVFDNLVRASQQPLTEDWQRVVLPSLRTGAESAGAYGGDRAALAEGQAAGDYAQSSQNIAAQLAAQQAALQQQLYQSERQLQTMAPQLIQAGMGLNMMPYGWMQQAGAGQQGLAQQRIDNTLARRQEQINAPWNGMSQYANILYGAPGGSETVYGQAPSGFAQGIQGALGGASLGGGLGSLAGAEGLSGMLPWLAGGGILGALGSFF